MAPALRMSDRRRHFLPILKRILSTLPKSKDIHMSVQDPASGSLLWSYDYNPLRFAAELVDLMRHVRERIEEIRCPMLIFHGRHDRSVPVRASEELAAKAIVPTELIILENSGHCLSLDGEREAVCAMSWQWIQRQQ
jgi:carboxylesterase